jgi:hypothetical protein
VEAWLDKEKIIDLPRAGHRFTPREGESAMPIGVSAWATKVAIQSVKLRRLKNDQ